MEGRKKGRKRKEGRKQGRTEDKELTSAAKQTHIIHTNYL